DRSTHEPVDDAPSLLQLYGLLPKRPRQRWRLDDPRHLRQLDHGGDVRCPCHAAVLWHGVLLPDCCDRRHTEHRDVGRLQLHTALSASSYPRDCVSADMSDLVEAIEAEARGDFAKALVHYAQLTESGSGLDRVGIFQALARCNEKLGRVKEAGAWRQRAGQGYLALKDTEMARDERQYLALVEYRNAVQDLHGDPSLPSIAKEYAAVLKDNFSGGGRPHSRGALRGRILPDAWRPSDRSEVFLRHRGGDERAGDDGRRSPASGGDDPGVRARDGFRDKGGSRRCGPRRADARVRPQADE